MPFYPIVVTDIQTTSGTVTLTAEERTVLEARLTAAEEAAHLMRIGQQAKVFVDQNGERVEFNLIKAPDLRAYILELRLLLGKSTGIRGPLIPTVRR